MPIVKLLVLGILKLIHSYLQDLDLLFIILDSIILRSNSFFTDD